MNPIRIDFAQPSLGRELASLGAVALLCALIGLGLWLGAFVSWRNAEEQQGVWQSELDSLQSKAWLRSAPEAAKPVISEAQAAAVNGAIRQLNLPWSELLNAIERATPGTVALLALEPDAQNRRIKGTAEVKDAKSMIHYIGRLRQQPFFSSVVLIRHETNTQDPNSPLRFMFEAEWLKAAQ